MTWSLSTLFASFQRPQRKPRVYIDSSRFNPDRVHRNGRAVLIITCNEAETIYQRVTEQLPWVSGVVVLDRGSEDGTPFIAAEAGAIVVIQEAGQTNEEALQKALRLARSFSHNIEIIQ